jgi:hypothetical protein
MTSIMFCDKELKYYVMNNNTIIYIHSDWLEDFEFLSLLTHMSDFCVLENLKLLAYPINDGTKIVIAKTFANQMEAIYPKVERYLLQKKSVLIASSTGVGKTHTILRAKAEFPNARYYDFANIINIENENISNCGLVILDNIHLGNPRFELIINTIKSHHLPILAAATVKNQKCNAITKTFYGLVDHSFIF